MSAQEGITRRDFVKAAAIAAGGAALLNSGRLLAQDKGERPFQAADVKILNPQNRVPISFIIDDSTCLVNLAYFGIPQFAEVWPNNYKQDWRKLPREIPDSFVRKFGEWCREHGVKGKYSIVPHPGCVGRLDRGLPGWSRKELDDSIRLVRELMMPDWDIHPEMVTHTRVIDTKTGHPYPEWSEKFMENWGWSQDKSAEVLTDYMSYALQILKNVGLDCEGITTPGGFGGQNRDNLAKATLESCRDVFKAEIPHYFRDLFTDDHSVAPLVQYASGLEGDDPKCVVSIIGCTGDWFGGWDGLEPGSVDNFITEDLKGGRLPQVIDKGEPAILVCHWPGIYFNGEEVGFNIFKEVVRRVHSRYDNLIWMKQSEIARYWAAKELTKIERQGSSVTFAAPFASPRFTIRLKASQPGIPKLALNAGPVKLERVNGILQLKSGTWHADDGNVTICFDLAKGKTILEI
ncbi:MAG TPA: twin-arginine translocation signal domain-containing protein [Sedimentisphaerales bacterium]|nr:twin-arginine translocation signal domain-containing protein [Sedimentisphaerales bacterium]